MNSRNKRDATRIVFDRDTEMFACVRCNAVMDYNFGFRYCPYCRRKVITTENRYAQTRADVKLSRRA